jgi:antitoxin component YwqK of YwqJK toxin-antitoxin module
MNTDWKKKEVTNPLGFKSIYFIDSYGLKQGEAFIHNPDGSLAEHCFYLNDYKYGPYKSWWENGSPMHFTSYCSPFTFHGENTTWWENGKMNSQGNYIKGKADGLHQEWNEAGSLINQINYTNGIKNGSYIEWHPNGIMKIKSTYTNGLKENIYTEWGQNGEIIFQGIFTKDELQYQLK